MRRVYKPLLALKRAIRRNDLRSIAALVSDPAQARDLTAHLDDSEKVVVQRVQDSVQTLDTLRAVIAVQPRTDVELKQIVDICGTPEAMQTLNLLMSPFEREQVRKALLTYAAVDELSRLENAPEMAYVKLAVARIYHKAHEAGVVLPNSLNWTKIRAALDFDERWSALNAALEAGDERAIFKAWDAKQLNEGLELLTEKDKQLLLKALHNTSRSERLATALASDDEERVAYAKREIAGSTGSPNLT